MPGGEAGTAGGYDEGAPGDRSALCRGLSAAGRQGERRGGDYIRYWLLMLSLFSTRRMVSAMRSAMVSCFTLLLCLV